MTGEGDVEKLMNDLKEKDALIQQIQKEFEDLQTTASKRIQQVRIYY